MLAGCGASASRLLFVLLAAASGAACMPPQGSSGDWPSPAEWHTPGYGWPPRISESAEQGPTRDALRPPASVAPPPSAPATSPASSSRPVATVEAQPVVPSMDADECLANLGSTGLTFEPQTEVRGVRAPIILKGLVGDIEYWANDRRPLLVDCRLGLALAKIGPVLRRHGVTRARFSGSYVYRNTRTGRLSLHAHGLAIDIHDVTIGAETLSVKHDFALQAGCGNDVPVLNRIACDLRDSGLFQELLTPDYNRDHRDHFHLAVPRAASDTAP